MKAVGVIAEYNPLHNGHVHHLEQARLAAEADAVVVAMSGDFVQRGEPAIMDKWTRTEHALKSGADLVIEIPVLFCLGNARQYAEAAVRLLEATGKVSGIAFGSESGDAEALTQTAVTLREHHDEIGKLTAELQRKGLSYPAARAAAYAEVVKAVSDGVPGIPEQPNDILAIEYIRAMRTAEPVVIKREGAGYGDPFENGKSYQSASAIRSMVFDGQDVSSHVPSHVAAAIRERHLSGPDTDKWFDALRYAVLSADTESIEDCPSGGEGLANLMKREAASAVSWTDLIKRIKSKRYTYTRLSRLCSQLLLGITRSRYDIGEPGYIRVLGFSERGRQLLAEIRDEGCAELPVLININKNADDPGENAVKLLGLDVHAADIYNLMTDSGLEEGSDHRRAPVIVK